MNITLIFGPGPKVRREYYYFRREAMQLRGLSCMCEDEGVETLLLPT